MTRYVIEAVTTEGKAASVETTDRTEYNRTIAWVSSDDRIAAYATRIYFGPRFIVGFSKVNTNGGI